MLLMDKAHDIDQCLKHDDVEGEKMIFYDKLKVQARLQKHEILKREEEEKKKRIERKKFVMQQVIHDVK